MNERNPFQIAVDDTKITQFRAALNRVFDAAPQIISPSVRADFLYDPAHAMAIADIGALVEWPAKALAHFKVCKRQLDAYRETMPPGFVLSDAKQDAALPPTLSYATREEVWAGIDAIIDTARRRGVPDSASSRA